MQRLIKVCATLHGIVVSIGDFHFTEVVEDTPNRVKGYAEATCGGQFSYETVKPTGWHVSACESASGHGGCSYCAMCLVTLEPDVPVVETPVPTIDDPVVNPIDHPVVGGSDEHGCCIGCGYNTWCPSLGRCTNEGEVCVIETNPEPEPVHLNPQCYENECDYTTGTLKLCGGDNQWGEVIHNSPRCPINTLVDTTSGDTTTTTSPTSDSSIPGIPWLALLGVAAIGGFVVYNGQKK